MVSNTDSTIENPSEEPSLKEKTAKGLFWGGVSNGVQQLLGMLFGIYLARKLSPEDYGLIGMLAIFTGIASTIINSGFSVALTNKQDVTHKDYNAVFWFTFFIGLILYVILFFSAPLIADFYGRTELVSLSRVVFLSFFFSGIAIVPYTIMFKNLMVKQQAQIDIIAMVASGIVGVILALKGFAYWALALQSVTYIVGGAILRCIITPWRPTIQLDFYPLKGMLSFSVKLFFTNIFLQINNNIISTLLGKFYNATQGGYYNQANKWMGMANQLIAGMINQVAQPVFVQVRGDIERQLNVFRKMQRFVAFIAFPAFGGLAFIAQEFILITIGDKWLPSVLFLQILCGWGIVSAFTILYSQLIIEKGKSNIYLKGNVFTGLSQLLIVVCMLKYGVLWMVIAYVVVYFLNLFYWQYWVKYFIRLSFRKAFEDILPYLGITCISIFIAWFITRNIVNLYFLLFLKIIIVAFFYLLITKLTNSVILKEIISFVKNKAEF